MKNLILNSEKIQIERTLGEGHWNSDGLFVGGEVEIKTINATVQPATGRQTQLLPEHRRNDETILIYTATEIFPASAEKVKKADIAIYKKRRFEIFTVKNWNDYNSILRYFEAIAVLESR